MQSGTEKRKKERERDTHRRWDIHLTDSYFLSPLSCVFSLSLFFSSRIWLASSNTTYEICSESFLFADRNKTHKVTLSRVYFTRQNSLSANVRSQFVKRNYWLEHFVLWEIRSKRLRCVFFSTNLFWNWIRRQYYWRSIQRIFFFLLLLFNFFVRQCNEWHLWLFQHLLANIDRLISMFLDEILSNVVVYLRRLMLRHR